MGFVLHAKNINLINGNSVKSIAKSLNITCNTNRDMMQKQIVNPVVSLRLPEEKITEIDRLVSRFAFKTRTDFFEKAIDSFVNELQTTKVVNLREFTKEEAKQEIMNYLKIKPGTYVSDMADELGMDVELAFSVVKELMEKKKVRRADANQ